MKMSKQEIARCLLLGDIIIQMKRLSYFLPRWFSFLQDIYKFEDKWKANNL